MLEEIEKLDQNDKKLVEKFVEELLKRKKYAKLRKEIEKRREEIKKNRVLSHKEIWDV